MKAWVDAKLSGRLKPTPPVVAQREDWTCGPAALRSALEQLGLPGAPEAEIARLASTSREDGTTPAQMVKAAKALGVKSAEARRLSGPGELAKLAPRRAVILDIQSLDMPASGWKGGHYVVLSRVGDGAIEVMDPMGGKKKALTFAELSKRWHDEEASGKRTERLAIILG